MKQNNMQNDEHTNSAIKNHINQLGDTIIAHSLRPNMELFKSTIIQRHEITAQFTMQQLINYIVDNTEF